MVKASSTHEAHSVGEAEAIRWSLNVVSESEEVWGKGTGAEVDDGSTSANELASEGLIMGCEPVFGLGLGFGSVIPPVEEEGIVG